MRQGNVALLDVAALGMIAAVLAAIILVVGCSGDASESQPKENAKPETPDTPEKRPAAPTRKSRLEFERDKLLCLNNLRNLAGLIEMTGAMRGRYPMLSGPNLLLYFVVKQEIDPRSEKRLETLFCPGDAKESLKKAGGREAYQSIDLKTGGHGHLTSYAGRDQRDLKSAAKPGGREVVLVIDDSDDHHGGRGFVVGLIGGAARWYDKVDRWKLVRDAKVVVGPDSNVEELRPLRAE